MILGSLRILLVVLGLLLPSSYSFRLELQSGQTKCIAEELKTNSMTVGKYHIVNPNEGHPLPEPHKLNVRVTTTTGRDYHHAENVEAGQFAFTTMEAGDYIACFTVPDHSPPVTLTVDVDWRSGIHAKDWSNVAKKGQVDGMALELKKMYDAVTSIREEMFNLRVREAEMQELNLATNSKMAWLSLVSLFVCLSVAGLQIWHLKIFFEKKKLI